MSSTSAVNPHQKHPHGNNRGLKQAYDFRDLAASQALALAECNICTLQERSLYSKALYDLNRVWSESSEVIRRLRGRPLPGSLRPEPRESTKSKRARARKDAQDSLPTPESPAEPPTPTPSA